MPHIGPVLEGRSFFCPHCGALYSATPSLVPKSEDEARRIAVNIAKLPEANNRLNARQATAGRARRHKFSVY